MVAHRTAEVFAYPAKADGKLVSVDERLKIARVEYNPTPVTPAGKIIPEVYDGSVIASVTRDKTITLIRAPLPTGWVVGSIWALSTSTYVKIVDVAPFKTPEAVPGWGKLSPGVQAKLSKHATIYAVRVELTPVTVPGEVDLVEFGDVYSSYAGAQLRQPLVLNFKVGDSIKRGDIVVYNRGFFSPNLDSKQVHWRLGVDAIIALSEQSKTYEDSCLISRRLSEDLTLHPVHERAVQVRAQSIVHSIVPVGTDVETIDQLCVIEDGELGAFTMDRDAPETIDFLAELNSKSPRAEYSGKIVGIEVFYSCPLSAMHPSVAKVVRDASAVRKARAAAAKGTLKGEVYLEPQQIAVGKKYKGVEFKDDTVLIVFKVQSSYTVEQGDKLVVMSASKTVVGGVMTKPTTVVETGEAVDVIFSTASVMNRMIGSFQLIGRASLCAREIQRKGVALYDGEES